jgi:ABC-type antimicrobial peptide transport system permease subunit
METITYIFNGLALVIGCLGLFAGLLFGSAWIVHKVMDGLKIWHIYMLAVSIRLHGKDYSDRQFWEAIAEKASKGRFFAKMIADYANQHAPDEDNAP